MFTRALCAILGSIWGGLSFAAGNGNPYITAVFAVIFMLPMIYRLTQSTHPVRTASSGTPCMSITNVSQRSGLVGCLAFTVVSIAEHNAGGGPSPTAMAAIRGAAMVVGVVASVIVNWVLWPFVARHDLRKGTSAMMFYCSIIYRSKSCKTRACPPILTPSRHGF